MAKTSKKNLAVWQKWASKFPMFASAGAEYKTPLRMVKAEAPDKPHQIYIYGQIGTSFASAENNCSAEFADMLSQIPDGEPIQLRINSPGGNFYEGLAIYNLARGRGVNTVVDGQAASVAADIFCAGTKREIPDTSNLMVHKAWGVFAGNSDDLTRAKGELDNVDELQAAILSRATGKGRDEVLKAMSEANGTGTEWNGADARTYGFGVAPEEEMADEADGDAEALIRTAIFAMCSSKISAAKAGGQPNQKPAEDDSVQNQNTKMRSKMEALLTSWQVAFTDKMTDDEICALVEKGKPTTATLPTPALAAPVAAKPDVTAEPALDPVSAKEFRDEKRRRIRAEITRLGENRVPNDKIDVWTDRALAAAKEETIYDEISAMARFDTGGDPVGFNRIESMRTPVLAGFQGQPTEMVANLFKEHATVAKRYTALRDNWERLFADATNRDRRLGRDIRAENNFAGAITTNFLIMGAITRLGPRCTALKAFSRDNTVDPYKPLASGIQKFNTTVQDGSDTMTDATDFTGTTTTSDSTLAGPAIAVHQYTEPLHLTNAQLNSGIRMADLIDAKLGSFLSKIVQVVTAPITVANFSTLTPDVVSPAAFGFSDLALLQGKLQKSRIKNCILAGPYIAQIANSPGFFQMAGTLDGLEDAWRAFGWDLIGLNTEWTGADPYVQGFACNPQAIGVISGLPLNPVEGIPGNVIQVGTAVLPGVDVAIATYLWMDANARTMRATYDIMLGATSIDTTAGVIIKSQ